jgi:hypothetical protein
MAETGSATPFVRATPTESYVAALSVIDAIVENGGALLYERYLASKEKEFAVERMAASLQHVVDWQLPTVDGATEYADPNYSGPIAALPAFAVMTGSWECEPEPLPAPLDSWARAVVPMRLPDMRRREVLLARRAAALEQEALRAAAAREKAEAAAAAAGAAEQSARAGRPGTVSSRPGTVGSQLATIAEGKDEGGDARQGGRASTPAVLSQRAAILASLDRKALAARESAEKELRASADAARRDSAMRKALNGRPFTLDEHGGIIVVEGVDAAALPAVKRETRVGVEGAEESASPSPSRGAERSSSRGQGARLQRADAAERERHDPNSSFYSSSTSQPSLVLGLEATGVEPGVRLQEDGRVWTGGAPLEEDTRHLTLQQVEMRRSLSASMFLSKELH